MKLSKKRLKQIYMTLLLLVMLIPISYFNNKKEYISSLEIPEYSNSSVITLNNNEPNFKDIDEVTYNFEKYYDQDYLKRCTLAYANISQNLMPTKDRESIGQVKPTGWHTVKYDIIEDKYLYNRCHLIGYQLTGENANINNLITCTSYMNKVSMLEIENKVAKYIRKTNNHVLYRVTPYFEDENLLAKGIQIEAYSVEDKGSGIKLNVFIYNIQPGIEIDYKTGDSKLKE